MDATLKPRTRDVISDTIAAVAGWIIQLAVQATQIVDQTLGALLGSAEDFSAAGSDQYYAILVGDQVTMTDAMVDLQDIIDAGGGAGGGTEAEVAADTHAYIAPGGDGAPIAVPARAIGAAAGATYFEWGSLDFGSNLTITGVATLVLLRGDVANILATDAIRFFFDLDDGAAEVSVTNGVLNITPPANNRWWGVNAQA